VKITIEGKQGEGKSIIARELFQKLHMSGKSVILADGFNSNNTEDNTCKKHDIVIVVKQEK